MLDSGFKRLAGFPILAVGMSMVSFILIKIGHDAVFFSERELEHLPLAYLWIALASIPAAMIHLKALDRWRDHTTRSGLLLAAVVTLHGWEEMKEREKRERNSQMQKRIAPGKGLKSRTSPPNMDQGPIRCWEPPP